MPNKKHVDLDNARVDEQRAVMEQIIEDDQCPFCLENLRQYHKEPILQETNHWILTPNQWPYQNTQLHLLAIYKDHATQLRHLKPAAGRELIKLFQWVEAEYNVPGGGWAMRFGDTDYSAGTVNHIHAQFLVPDIHASNYAEKPVRLKIGKIGLESELK